jgi:uncharacterized protein
VRAVLDVNVLISAVLSPRSTCAELLQLVRDGDIELVTSPGLLDELHRTLSRRKFRSRATDEDVTEYVDELRELAETRPDAAAMPGITRDPKDDYLVALALAAGVDALVSGDKDLLAVDVVRVLTPREAVEAMHR